MEYRDLLKDEIGQIGKVLAKIISEFTQLKAKSPTLAIETTSMELKKHLNIDLDAITKLTYDKIKESFHKKNLSPIHIENLSDLLIEIAILKKQKVYFTTALTFLDLADEISSTISFERLGKKQRIEKEMNNMMF